MNDNANILTKEQNELLLEVKDMLKAVIDGQAQLLQEVQELKDEQKKLHEEIRMSNFVLNQISIRNEMLN